MLDKYPGLLLVVAVAAWAPVGSTKPLPEPGAADRVFAEASDGTLVHNASGLRFPATAAGFRRTQANVFSSTGDYIGVEYTKALSPGGQIQARVAVVDIGDMNPKTHYTIMKPRAIHGLSGLRIVSEGPYRQAAGSEGYGGVFTGTRNGVSGTVGLWAFEQGRWDLRIQAEFPNSYSGQAEIDVGDLVDALRSVNRGS